ncbi:hypothetical protein NGB36_01835 [Streptomyces sp. RB6PN25]|uniref:Uncharacterized protein n=1 Tax=Streptomyces humicola TaxID=2953240 RepID=A0ABT1PNW8_9ACTN|nr:hypothetical protein [Streptomyces humicola]MCQ4079377.1 hypothetical protein [Streptomyces humicola]
MGEHVHVRVNHSLGVTEDGELIEMSRCRCGATFSRTYQPQEGLPEE